MYKIINKFYRFELLLIITLPAILFMHSVSFGQQFWTLTNGPYGGHFRCLTLDKKNNIIYAGTFGEGLYYSTNSGTEWNKVNDISSYGINSIQVDKNGNIFTATTNGIYRSTDRGANWIWLSGSIPYYNRNFTSLIITESGKIFAAANIGPIIRSTNNGDTWEESHSPAEFSSLGINSLGHIFAGFASYHGRFDYEHGVYRSTDEGVTWEKLPINFQASSFVSNNSGDFFVGTYTNNIFRSTDNGENWEKISLNSFGTYISSLFIDDTGTIFAGSNNGILYSEDNGSNWNFINSENLSFPIYSLIIDFNNYLYAGTNGLGILQSKDNGSNWNYVNNGLNHLSVNALTISKTGQIWVGTEYGIFTSSDHGQNWTAKNTGLGNKNINHINIMDNGSIFTTVSNSDGNALFRSDDSGESWQSVNDIGQTSIISIDVTESGSIFLATTSGLFRSTNYGVVWDSISQFPYGTEVSKVATSSNGYVIAVSGSNTFLSDDNGDSWKQLKITNVINLLFTNSGEIYAGSGGHTDSVTQIHSSGLFYSPDYGDSWSLTGITDTAVVISLASNSIGNIFVSTYGNGISLVFSSDKGRHWQQLDYNTRQSSIPYSLVLDPDNYLFGGTYEGLFKSQNPSGVSFFQNVKSFNLKQNYPNPFNPTTTIEYSIPLQTNVIIKIYDLLGREVATLVNEEKAAGNYKAEFDGGNLPSGTYFYRMETGRFSETKKLLILK